MRRVRAQGSGGPGTTKVSTRHARPGHADEGGPSAVWPKLDATEAASLGAGIGKDGLVAAVVAKLYGHRLTSPNRARGTTIHAAVSTTKRRRTERELGKLHTLSKLPLAARGAIQHSQAKLEVTLVAISPGRGLDDDNLIAAFKSIRDGVADGVGLRDDSDPRIEFWYEKRRGRKGQYEVHIEYRMRPLE